MSAHSAVAVIDVLLESAHDLREAQKAICDQLCDPRVIKALEVAAEMLEDAPEDTGESFSKMLDEVRGLQDEIRMLRARHLEHEADMTSMKAESDGQISFLNAALKQAQHELTQYRKNLVAADIQQELDDMDERARVAPDQRGGFDPAVASDDVLFARAGLQVIEG